MLHKNTKHIFLQVGLLSLGILAVFQVANYAIAGQSDTEISSSNELIYQSATEQSLSQVGVALGTGVGIRFDNEGYSETTFYGEVGELGTTPSQTRAIRARLLGENMVIVKEYLSLAKTDVLELLEGSDNRRKTLDTFISQLELRYKNAAISQVNLQNQKSLLLAEMESKSNEVETVKSQISTDFTVNDDQSVLDDVDEYLRLKNEITSDFADIVFINQFLAQYQFLNNYNKRLLDTLINNREAIISESFVVVPDSGDEFLRQFRLLYEEEEFKARQ